MENSESRPNRPAEDSEQISDPSKVVRMLDRFTHHYMPLKVRIPGHKESYTSCIVEVDRKHVLLDELLPSSGHDLLLSEGAIKVTGKIDGIDILFSTTLINVINKDRMISYRMKLPSLVEYRQRRNNYRVHIPISLKLSVIMENNSGGMALGELHNLSYGGAGMIFLANQSIMNANQPHECAIKLHDGSWIYCTAILRYLKDIPSRETQYLGVQFLGLSSIQSRLIGRCINILEREMISKRVAL